MTDRPGGAILEPPHQPATPHKEAVMAEVKIKPGSLTIQIEDQGKTVEFNCHWMSPLTRVVLEPKGQPAREIWRVPEPASV